MEVSPIPSTEIKEISLEALLMFGSVAFFRRPENGLKYWSSNTKPQWLEGRWK